MKSKTWILLLGAVLALCLGLSIFLTAPGGEARYADIFSQRTLLRTVDLLIDQEFTVDTPGGGQNVVTVRDGKIAVTAANCPDHYCMQRGYCSGGTPIVCLPNQLVIEFAGEQDVDAAVG